MNICFKTYIDIDKNNMSNRRYLELDSTYRNRTEFSNPAKFDVLISQRGPKDKYHAVDPVSNMAPILTFNGIFDLVAGTNTITLTDFATGDISSTNSNTRFVLEAPTGELVTKDGFYVGTILELSTGEVRRITGYEFLGDNGGVDNAAFTVLTPFPDGFDPTASTITNPSDFTITPDPIIFIPNGKSIGNFYNTQLIYNQTTNTSIPIKSYDGLTHLAILDGDIPVGWTISDQYIIRQENTRMTLTSGDLPPIGSNRFEVVDTVCPSPELVNSFISTSTGAPSIGRIVKDELIQYPPPDGPTGARYITICSSDEFTVPNTGGVVYDILNYSYDNENPFVYTGSVVSQQEMVCYEIELLNLILPNTDLVTGGRIAFYLHMCM